ncbi:MAG: hypothetical protein QXU75_07455 [Candidatus Methanomethylicaceae archaeon]
MITHENGERNRLKFEIKDKDWLRRQKELRELYENNKAEEQARIMAGKYKPSVRTTEST